MSELKLLRQLIKETLEDVYWNLQLQADEPRSKVSQPEHLPKSDEHWIETPGDQGRLAKLRVMTKKKISNVVRDDHQRIIRIHVQNKRYVWNPVERRFELVSAKH